LRHCKGCGQILDDCWCDDEDEGGEPESTGAIERIDIAQTTDETWRRMLG